MAKRLTKPSLKISKKEHTHQFKSLIKALKPRVYITNSSDFKNLVQELTGNGSQSLAQSSFSPPLTTPVVSPEPARVIQIDDHDSPDPRSDNISDFSVINPDNCMFMQSDDSNCSSEELAFQWPQDQLIDYDSSNPSLGYSPDPSLDNMFTQFDHSSNCSSEESGLQWSQDRDVNIEIELRNIESWLLDFDSSACSHDVSLVPMSTFEYDYN